MDAHLPAYRKHIGGMHQPLETVRGGYLHLIVDALENQVGHNTLEGSVLRLYKVNVLRPDDHIPTGLLLPNTLVNTSAKRAAEDSTSSSRIMIPGTILLSPMKSATNLELGW